MLAQTYNLNCFSLASCIWPDWEKLEKFLPFRFPLARSLARLAFAHLKSLSSPSRPQWVVFVFELSSSSSSSSSAYCPRRCQLVVSLTLFVCWPSQVWVNPSSLCSGCRSNSIPGAQLPPVCKIGPLSFSSPLSTPNSASPACDSLGSCKLRAR